MKKLLAMLLSLIMLLVLLPAAVADDTPAEYTLVIKGGQTNENVATIDGVNCLKVDVMLTGTIEEAVFGFKFGIGYDPEQLTLKDFEAGDTLQNMTVNDKVPGSVVCACISLEGTVVNAERKMITLYFELDEEALAAKGVITYGSNVKEVTTQVKEATVDCGIIYGTDAFSAGLTVVDTATKDMCGQVIYPAAVLKVAKHPAEAKAFLDYLTGAEACAIFEAVGFSPMGK